MGPAPPVPRSLVFHMSSSSVFFLVQGVCFRQAGEKGLDRIGRQETAGTLESGSPADRADVIIYRRTSREVQRPESSR